MIYRIFAAIGLLTLTACNAGAVPVRIDVSGHVSQVDAFLSQFASIGDPMFGYFIYDAEIVVSVSQFAPNRHIHYAPVLRYELHLGSLVSTGSNGRIETSNDYTDTENRFLDRLIFQNGHSDPQVPAIENTLSVHRLGTSFIFHDYDDANALSDLEVPALVPLDLFDPGSSRVSIQTIPLGNTEWEVVYGTITDIQQRALPSPSTLALLISGILATIRLQALPT